ncbi:hypothetical protein SEVIR_7G030400v4 [Setaria viridis]|uniref:Glabrous enhancer-binding protein-like DBD domain-containing protein n=1 Tax=Setaria viridis TaxID=4556 RepID=A0A4U6TPJ5_SETVI|nr:probable transcription factor At1g61730 [Setaria viridis]XP_034602535.1 probable transcription factor At1g61730 [Setaria viridis]TKW02923.1 hypothetical protein SEVIR_7G030400v2 [Setaria viridis]
MNRPPHSSRTADLVSPAADAAVEEAPMAASKPAAGARKKPSVAFVRVWSEADEVRILEGLAAYAADHGAPPARSQLHAALEGRSLDKAEFTVTEIYEKVRRLRTKYCNLRDAGGPPVPEGGEDGGDEVRKYELSKAIWGDQPANVAKKGGSTSAAAVAVLPKAGGAIPRVRRGLEELQGLFPCLAAEVEKVTNDEMLAPVLKRAFEFIDDQKAGELDDKVKKQMVKEAQVTMSGAALRDEVLKMLIRSMEIDMASVV